MAQDQAPAAVVDSLQRPVRPAAWIDSSGHPHHLSHVQGVSERRLYGPLQPLYDKAALDAAVAAERERCGNAYGSREVAMTAEIARLRAALALAANRMDVLALDHDYGNTRRNITDDWAKEARDALGPNQC